MSRWQGHIVTERTKPQEAWQEVTECPDQVLFYNEQLTLRRWLLQELVWPSLG